MLVSQSGVRMPKVLLLVSVALASISSAAQTSIEGSVRDRAGKSVPDARVTLQPEEGKTVRAITDSAGSFHFSALDAGRYTLQAQADGFYVSIVDFVLRPRQPLSFTIELQPKDSAKQAVEVSAHSLLVDPQKTGSSYTFTQQDLEKASRPADGLHRRSGQ